MVKKIVKKEVKKVVKKVVKPVKVAVKKTPAKKVVVKQPKLEVPIFTLTEVPDAVETIIEMVDGVIVSETIVDKSVDKREIIGYHPWNGKPEYRDPETGRTYYED